ncbi:MAG TPA: thioredoxin domain-containing protein [Gemmatimonadaceae bacterium]|nr:thioredoxin domain-containing protein [Gemmatimonadaceae bacterium]
MPATSSVRALLVGATAAFLAACGADAAEPKRQAPADRAAAGVLDTIMPATVAEPRTDGAHPRVVLHGVDLTGVGYDRGDPNAPIVIVEFSDFGCPYCAQHALRTLPSLEREFIATGKVFYKHVPFVMGMFPNGDRAARAAECAGEQGRFWPMHDSVYVHQKDWKRGREPDEVLAALARAVAPDADQWAACYAADRQAARTRAAGEGAARLGVRATPTMFVNGQLVQGALPLDIMRQGLNAMLPERGR